MTFGNKKGGEDMSGFPKTSEEKNYEKMVEIIVIHNLSGDDVLQLFTDYHGLQLMSDDFLENTMNCEGYSI